MALMLHFETPEAAWLWYFPSLSFEGKRWLSRYEGTHSTESVIQAIKITAQRFKLTAEEDRMRYVGGILRRQAFLRTQPENVQEAVQEAVQANSRVNLVTLYWNRKFSRSLEPGKAAHWLQYLDVVAIQSVIHYSRHWRDCCEVMDEIIAERQAKAATTKLAMASAAGC